MSRYSMSASRKGLQNKGCEIGVSIGNPNHEGDKFQSIMDWADRRFEFCIITVSDTLHRHNLVGEGMEESEAYARSLEQGDIWLSQNVAALRSVEHADLRIKRWDEWLLHPDYESVHRMLVDYRDTNKGLQDALHQDIDNFLARKKRRGEDFDYDRVMRSSTEFLIEEIACYILIGRTYAALRVYPAKDMACFRYMRGGHVPEGLKGLELAPHLDLNFKRKIAEDEREEGRMRAA